MQFHTLKRTHENKKGKYVGRGGKRGKTAGRGTKGQKARAGRKIRPEIRDVIKRLPKLRGRGQNLFRSIEQKPVAFNLNVIEALFKAGETVSSRTLSERGVLQGIGGKAPRVKILGGGEIAKKLTFDGVQVSAEARTRIEKAGGTIK